MCRPASGTHSNWTTCVPSWMATQRRKVAARRRAPPRARSRFSPTNRRRGGRGGAEEGEIELAEHAPGRVAGREPDLEAERGAGGAAKRWPERPGRVDLLGEPALERERRHRASSRARCATTRLARSARRGGGCAGGPARRTRRPPRCPPRPQRPRPPGGKGVPAACGQADHRAGGALGQTPVDDPSSARSRVLARRVALDVAQGAEHLVVERRGDLEARREVEVGAPARPTSPNWTLARRPRGRSAARPRRRPSAQAARRSSRRSERRRRNRG